MERVDGGRVPQQQDHVRVTTAAERPADPPLLASRLSPAAPREPVVARPRLLRRLDQGSAGPVTLVAGPAGWGKTTLLASWVRLIVAPPEAGPVPAAPEVGEGLATLDVGPGGALPGAGLRPAWVSVEAGDDGDRLWTYLAAALRAATGPADDQPSGPMPAGPPRPDQLEVLAAALAAADRPVLLVLDDLHRITDPAALTGLEFLLRHSEQRLHLVIGARAGLPLALHRLRLAGELTEIGPDELAFTDDEVADLLTALGVPMPAAALRRCVSAPVVGRRRCGSPRWRCAGSPTRRAGWSSSVATSRTSPVTCTRRCSPRSTRPTGTCCCAAHSPGRSAPTWPRR
ncbi:hypothetical protein GCM10027614_29780 [Micromonospora vulcania]